jgi:regulation of enolase protein 1 (concanavalin A-like superfamily)
MAAIKIGSIPGEFAWQLDPTDWSLSDDGVLSMSAGPKTDLFINPQGGEPVLNAPRLLASFEGDFQLSARVSVDFDGTYDAGVLLFWLNDTTWAKLCFEYSPQGNPMIVSVVTQGVSDDCNSFVVQGNSVWMRISRIGKGLAFHASLDGQWWDLIRSFSLGAGDTIQAGFEVQAPTGEHCSARFEQITFVAERLAELRDGK